MLSCDENQRSQFDYLWCCLEWTHRLRRLTPPTVNLSASILYLWDRTLQTVLKSRISCQSWCSHCSLSTAKDHRLQVPTGTLQAPASDADQDTEPTECLYSSHRRDSCSFLPELRQLMLHLGGSSVDQLTEQTLHGGWGRRPHEASFFGTPLLKCRPGVLINHAFLVCSICCMLLKTHQSHVLSSKWHQSMTSFSHLRKSRCCWIFICKL